MTMDNGERFRLRWDKFESNLGQSFQNLRQENDFFDVTLACDDEQLEAHKLVLSASSPFFKNILRKNPHQHPLIYLKGVKHSHLLYILDYVYYGEVNVKTVDLNHFLRVAEELKIKGLTQEDFDNNVSNTEQDNVNKIQESMPPTTPKIAAEQERSYYGSSNKTVKIEPGRMLALEPPVGVEEPPNNEDLHRIFTGTNNYGHMSAEQKLAEHPIPENGEMPRGPTAKRTREEETSYYEESKLVRPLVMRQNLEPTVGENHVENTTTLNNEDLNYMGVFQGANNYGNNTSAEQKALEHPLMDNRGTPRGPLTDSCTYCEFKSNNKHVLKTHIQGIHEGVRYSCDHCPTKTTQKSSLKRHIKMVHKDLSF